MLNFPWGKHVTHRRYTLNSNNREYFVKQMTEQYSEYHIKDVVTFHGELIEQIRKVVTRNNLDHRKTTMRRSYTQNKQVNAWNSIVRRTHREWINSGKTEEGSVASQETPKACSVVRREVREKYQESFLGKMFATRSTKEIWNEVDKVRGVKRGVRWWGIHGRYVQLMT